MRGKVVINKMNKINYTNEGFEEPKERPRRKELVTRYDYCLAIANTIKKPIGYVLGKTKGWPMDWYYSIVSECKQLTNQTSKIKYIMYFIREARIK